LRNIKGIKDVIAEGNKITLLSQSGANNLEDIIRVAQSYKIVSIQSDTPTLEDVFLTLTGKTLRDEEE
jgi:ABC-2 type transport system ATP-binding protein